MDAQQTTDLGIPGYADAVRLGSGAFGSVFRAREAAFNRDVAIKIFRPSADTLDFDSFRRECLAIGSLTECREIVTLFNSGQTSRGEPFIVMEYAAGGVLSDRLRRTGPIPEVDGRVLMRKMATALDAAHRAGVLHRDVKPSNILMARDGSPLLADFGVARLLDSTSTTIPGVTGTIVYMAPELFEDSSASPATDVYALGVTVYEALAGVAPYTGQSGASIPALIRRIVEGEQADPTTLPVAPGFAAVLDRCLARDPSERYSSAAELLVALDALESPPPAREDPVTPASAPPPHAGQVWHRGFTSPSEAPEAQPDLPGPWPTASDYVAAIQQVSKPLARHFEFATATPARHPQWGTPLSATGQNAAVFELEHPEGPLALRLFTRSPGTAARRYHLLGLHLGGRPSHSIPPSRWIASGLTVDGQVRPAVLMPWVVGVPLDQAVDDLVEAGDRAGIRALAGAFDAVVDDLRLRGMEHGDLQCGNILVDGSRVLLVDFDGAYVPSMTPDLAPGETGHPYFQHPGRTSEHWGTGVDDFSVQVIRLSLHALAADPSLWRFHNAENLIFTDADFAPAADTPVWQVVEAIADPEVREGAVTLRALCAAPGPMRAVAATEVVVPPTVLPGPQGVPATQVGTVLSTVSVTAAPTAGSGVQWWDEEPIPVATSSRGAAAAAAPMAPAASVVSRGDVEEGRSFLNILGSNGLAVGATGGIVAGLAACLTYRFVGQHLVPLEAGPALFMLLVGGILGGVLGATPELTMKAGRRAAVRGVLGLLIGALGALLGLGFFQLLIADVNLPDMPPAWMILTPWAVAGGAVGLAIGVVRASARTALAGLVGGVLGGLLGGWLHVLTQPRWTRFATHGLVLDIDTGNVATLLAVVTACLLVGMSIGGFERLTRAAWVTVVEGPMRGREVTIDRGRLIIGSGSTAGLKAAGAGVRPEHVEIRIEGDRAVATGTGAFSIDGDTVETATPHVLRDGAVLAVGGMFVRFRWRSGR